MRVHTPRKHFSLGINTRLTTLTFWLGLEARKLGLCWLVFILFLRFDLIKAGGSQTEMSFKQYDAGEYVDLLNEIQKCFSGPQEV